MFAGIVYIYILSHLYVWFEGLGLNVLPTMLRSVMMDMMSNGMSMIMISIWLIIKCLELWFGSMQFSMGGLLAGTRIVWNGQDIWGNGIAVWAKGPIMQLTTDGENNNKHLK